MTNIVHMKSNRDEGSKAAGEISPDEAHKALQRFVDAYFGNHNEKPRISIPADVERDDDILLTAFISQSARKINPLTHEERSKFRELVASLASDHDGEPWMWNELEHWLDRCQGASRRA